MINAYNRPKTNAWLQKMKSFENIVEWWGVRDIFTDNDYNVFDLEYNGDFLVKTHRKIPEYEMQWSEKYYRNVKECIKLFMRNDK